MPILNNRVFLGLYNMNIVSNYVTFLVNEML